MVEHGEHDYEQLTDRVMSRHLTRIAKRGDIIACPGFAKRRHGSFGIVAAFRVDMIFDPRFCALTKNGLQCGVTRLELQRE